MTTSVVVKENELTALQLAVMQALWKLGEVGTAEVLLELKRQGRDLAPTTVATLLQRMCKQGWVAHRKKGRGLLYRATVEQQEAAGNALRRVVERFFGGRPSALTAQLLGSEDINDEEIREIRRLLAARDAKP